MLFLKKLVNVIIIYFMISNLQKSRWVLFVKIYIITWVLLLPIGATHAFDVDAAYQQWLTVQDKPDESEFLINLFIEEQMYGEYPQIVRQRFREIASIDDAKILLQQLIDTEQQDKHISVHTLLKEFSGDEFILLCEGYFYQATRYGMRNKLFNLITRQNSLSAFESATRALDALQEQGLDQARHATSRNSGTPVT